MFKNIIPANRVQLNKYMLTIEPAVGQILATSIGGLEEEIDAAELPDRTKRSGGRSKSVTFDIKVPSHDLSNVAMRVWYEQCKAALLGYLKIGTLVIFTEFGSPGLTRTFYNMWISKCSEPDLEMENEGTMHVTTWTIEADEIISTF
jgi:hypothetical protein